MTVGTAMIVRFALLSVSALLLGFLAYMGTRWPLSSFQLEDQLLGFRDKYWSTYSTCPTTGEVCVNTKCAPSVLRLYFQCRTRLVDAFGTLPQDMGSLFSFGAYWFVCSAAAIILALRWFENRSILISCAYIAMPIVLYGILSHVCKPPHELPKPFSKKIPRMEDTEEFENVINDYCMHLNSCSEIVEKAASEARLCRTCAAVLSAVMWGMVIATVLPV